MMEREEKLPTLPSIGKLLESRSEKTRDFCGSNEYSKVQIDRIQGPIRARM